THSDDQFDRTYTWQGKLTGNSVRNGSPRYRHVRAPIAGRRTDAGLGVGPGERLLARRERLGSFELEMKHERSIQSDSQAQPGAGVAPTPEERASDSTSPRRAWWRWARSKRTASSTAPHSEESRLIICAAEEGRLILAPSELYSMRRVRVCRRLTDSAATGQATAPPKSPLRD